MAYHGPSYGLSRECQMKSQAKFDNIRAREACEWLEAISGQNLDFGSDEGMRDQLDFGNALKDGQAICHLINALMPGAVKKVNTMKAPFKQRENIELFLKSCEKYGLKSQDLFQVNDLFENKNLYMVVDCLFGLGGLAQKKNFDGPVIGVKVSKENKRNFSQDTLLESQKIIGLQYGSNKGASQSGMTSYGSGRQIIPGDAQKSTCSESQKIIGLQSGSNKGASQAGMTPYGAPRQIIPDDLLDAERKEKMNGEDISDELRQTHINNHDASEDEESRDDDNDSGAQIGETIPRSPSPSHSDYSDDQTDDLNVETGKKFSYQETRNVNQTEHTPTSEFVNTDLCNNIEKYAQISAPKISINSDAGKDPAFHPENDATQINEAEI